MKINYNHSLSMLFVVLCTCFKLMGQCTNTNLNPTSDIIAPSFYDEMIVVSTMNNAGDYFVTKNLTVGETYIFSSSSILADYISIRNTDGDLLDHGQAPKTYTITGDVEVQVHINLTSSVCDSDNVDRTTTVVCTTCPPIPPGIGVGISNPESELDVSGIIKIGNNSRPAKAGMIRWNDETEDFEGYNGTNWVSLTKVKNGWGSGSPLNVTYPDSKITASDGEFDDRFGYSVSISGDYAIIGAHRNDDGVNGNRGSAYIFHRAGTVWSEQAKLTPSDGGSSDHFGYSVSISGDYAIIGAYGHYIGMNSSPGSAYIFHRAGTVWSEQAKLIATDGEDNDQFGWSVSISGDYAIIGADKDDVGVNGNQGSAYIFHRLGTVWSEQAKLTASDGENNDWFGRSVFLSEDYVIIGAFGDNIGGNSNVGSSYIFHRLGTTWSEQAKLTASDGGNSDNFGFSVSISRDYAIIGAYQHHFDHGAAYIFHRSGTIWSEQAKLTASDGKSGDNFGWSVAISEDYAIIGSYTDESANIFARTGNTWTEKNRITTSDGAVYDRFGVSVSISGENVIIGAGLDHIGDNNDQGSAYFLWK